MTDSSNVEPESSVVAGQTGFVDRQGNAHPYTPLIQGKEGSQKPQVTKQGPSGVITQEPTGKVR